MTLSDDSQRSIPLVLTSVAVAATLLSVQTLDINWYLALGLHCAILVLLVFATNESQAKYGFGPRRLLILLAYGCVIALEFIHRNSLILIYTVMLSSILVFFAAERWCYGFIAINSLVFLTIRYFYWDAGVDWRDALLWSTFNIFAMLVTVRMLREQHAREEISLVNQQLQSTQALLTQSAAENERLSMARELHDHVGHQLTALIIQLDIARRSVDQAQVETVEQSYQQAKELLASIRTVVSNSRHGGDLDLRSALTQLCQDLPRIQCQLDYQDSVHITNVSQAQCLLRCCQEAISNSLKHSFASHIQIQLFNQNDKHILVIQDDGRSHRDIEAGNGLMGMSERCQELGGCLEYRSGNDGFRIRIELPHD